MAMVVDFVSKKLSGKRTLMVVSRDSVLEDTLHYLSKPDFTLTSEITVRITTIECYTIMKCVTVHVCKGYSLT